MASVPILDPYLVNFWQQVCDLAVDYDSVIALNPEIKAREKLINVLWDTQRDELVTMVADAMTAANVVIDAARGLSPRPVLNTPVAVGDNPIYPREFEVIPNYAGVTNISYDRAEFNRSAIPPVGILPGWWYVGEDLYRMCLRADDYLSTPLEPVTGVTLGVWGASIYYGLISLQLLHNDYATAKNSAKSASDQIISILNEKSRRNR